MTTNENERLAALLDEADGALDGALSFFRRANELMMFAVGADPGLAPDDPAVIKIRDRIGSVVESLARQLLLARDRHGLPLDSEPPACDREGKPSRLGIGLRGGRLWAPLVEFRDGLRGRDAARCIGGLERIRVLALEIRRDAGLEAAGVGSASRSLAAGYTSHSEDFSTVSWFGRRYEFNATQARVIALLWAEWERGGHGLGEVTVGDKIDSGNERYRLAHTFRSRRGPHAAWGTMIVRIERGVYALRAPGARITE